MSNSDEEIFFRDFVDVRSDDPVRVIEKMPDNDFVDLVIADLGRRYSNKRFLRKLGNDQNSWTAFFFCGRQEICDYLDFAREEDKEFDILVSSVLETHRKDENGLRDDVTYIVMIRDRGMDFNESGLNKSDTKFYLSRDREREFKKQKDMMLIAKLIRLGSEAGDIVLGLFDKDGGIATGCRKLGRRCISVNRSEGKCREVRRRIDNIGLQPELFKNQSVEQLGF